MKGSLHRRLISVHEPGTSPLHVWGTWHVVTEPAILARANTPRDAIWSPEGNSTRADRECSPTKPGLFVYAWLSEGRARCVCLLDSGLLGVRRFVLNFQVRRLNHHKPCESFYLFFNGGFSTLIFTAIQSSGDLRGSSRLLGQVNTVEHFAEHRSSAGSRSRPPSAHHRTAAECSPFSHLCEPCEDAGQVE